MDKIALFLLLALPLLLLATYLMAAKSKSFFKIFVIHTLLFICYMAFTYNYSYLINGQDPYGLEQLGLGIFFIVTHIISAFIERLYRHRIEKSRNKANNK